MMACDKCGKDSALHFEYENLLGQWGVKGALCSECYQEKCEQEQAYRQAMFRVREEPTA